MFHLLFWPLLLLLLAGLLRAAHDAMSFTPGCLARFGAFWDNRESWENKYRDRDPTKGPAFVGAATWAVGLTDAWHLSNALAWLCFEVAYLLVAWPAYHWWALLPLAVRRLVFEPAYAWFRKQA